MKIERTKNATRNIVFGLIVKIYQILGPFILRTIFIYTLGMEYLGLNSLFTSVLSVLNLTELGVGSAMVFSMYKPIAENDVEKICALMQLYKKYYRIIGAVILALGLILLPFIPQLITGNVPNDINVYILYLLNLASTVASYWLFSYKNCLLSAYQRIDIGNKITLVISTVEYLIQAISLLVVGNYYLYLIVTIVCRVISNITTAIVVSKLYPQYEARGELEKQEIKSINQRVRDLFTARLGGVVVNSADSIVISAFLGLTLLAVYNNYYYIISSVMGFISIIFNSCLAGIGNSLVTESLDKNYKDFKVMSFIVTWIIHFSTVCFLCLFQPFMGLWVGKENMFNMFTIVLFCVYFYVCELSMVWATYKDAGGIWHEDRFRPLIGASANLLLNIFFVKVVGIGVYGILLSTIVSYVCISMPWLLRNLFKIMFKRGCRKYLFSTIGHFVCTCISCVIAYFLCSLISVTGGLQIVLNLLVCMVVPNVFLFIVFRKTEEFRNAVLLIKRVLHIRS